MNFDEIVVKESPGLCRCCLSEGCYKDLGTEYTWMNDPEIYADMLLDCFDIGISQHNDGPNGPKRLICEVCITRLRDACNFKKQVLDSEKRFINMLGRGEFRPKMLIYQPQNKELKSEAVETEEPTEYGDLTEVEFLEDMDEEEVIKTEDISVATTSEDTDGPKPKRGRPRKEEEKPPKPGKKAKVTKDIKKEEALEELLNIIIEDTTIQPFRWHHSKYKCFYCPETFVQSLELKNHCTHANDSVDLKKIINTTKYKDCRIKLDLSEAKCLKCGEKIKSFSVFLQHLSDKHDIIFDKEIRNTFDAFSLSDKGMHCLVCGQFFQFFAPLLTHHNKFHTHQSTCKLCGVGIRGKHNIYNHIMLCHGVIRCKICNKTFPTRYALNNHIGRVHNKDDFKCQMCDKVFENKYMKTRHLALVHNVKSFQIVCEICSKVFTRNSKYVAHKQRVHYKEKACACEVCGHRTYNVEALNAHMMKHNEDLPFKCDVCDKAFRSKKNVARHMQSAKHIERQTRQEQGD